MDKPVITDFKFVVGGDIHIGLNNRSRDTLGIPDRHLELMNSVKYMLQYAIDNKVSFITLVGDIFNINNPSQMYYADLFPMFAEVSKANIPVFIIPGNHDAINTICEGNALRSIFKSKLSGIHIMNTISVNSMAIPGCQLVFIPHINRCEYSVYNAEAETAYIQEKINGLNMLQDAAKLVFGHAMVDGSIQGAERLIMRGGEQAYNVPISGTQAYFFGHMHTPQQMPYAGVELYYTGSMQCCDFGERKDIKSFIVGTYTYHKGVTNIERMGLPTRKYVQLDIKGYDEYAAQFEKKGVKVNPDIADSIVKVKINIDANQKGQINETKIQAYCKKAYWVEIDYDINREIATRNVNVTAEADPDVAFREWYQAKKYPDADLEKTLEVHAKIMAEATAVEK